MSSITRKRLSPVRRVVAAVAVAAAAFSALTACSSEENENAAIRYQVMPGFPLVIELADALGYYDGLSMEYSGNVSGGPEAAQAVAAGSIDVGQVYNGTITKVVSLGVPVKAVIAGYGFNEDTDYVIATKKGSGVVGPRDFIGKRVAVNTLGASSEAFLDTWLRGEGLTEDELKTVTLVPLPQISAPAALDKGEIDAAIVSTAVISQLPNPADYQKVLSYTDYNGPRTDGSLVVSRKAIEQRPDQLRTLVSGAGRAFDWANENGPEATKAKMGEYYKSKGYQQLADGLGFWSGSFGVTAPQGRLTDDDFTRWNGWLTADKQVTGEIAPVSDVYTNEFNEAPDAQ